MRVLVINRCWKPAGGVETCVRDLQRVLEERGHEVVPFAIADPANWPTPYSRYFPPPVDFRGTSTRDRARAVARATLARDSRRALRALLDDVKVDVAHVFNSYHYLGALTLLELRRRRIPVVLSLHDYKVCCPNVSFFSERTRRLCTLCMDHRFAYVWAPTVTRCRESSVTSGLMLSAEAITTHLAGVYQRVPTVVTVLNSLQRRALEHAGIDDDQVIQVPNFVELDEPPTADRHRDVLFVGRLILLKGVDVLIRACAREHLPLRIVGDGPARAGLESLAHERGCDATFTGELSADGVKEEMRNAAVLAAPSLWPDVAPLVVMEAWAAGLPVVGSDVGGISDFLADGRGVLCLPDDEQSLATALRSVLDGPAGGMPLVARARAYAQTELSRDRWIQRMRVVYDRAGLAL